MTAPYGRINTSALRHTYPYGKNDMVLRYASAATMATDVEDIFRRHPECRRIIVPIPAGDVESLAECEKAGLRYVLDVEQRDGQELALMVAEQGWVATINETIEGLDLS